MVDHKLTPNIKQMIDFFQKHKFSPRTILQMGAELHEKANTINQRLIRDEEYFFHSEDTKPKLVSLNVYRPEVLGYIFKSQCQSCKKTFKIKELNTFYNDGNDQNNSWGNVEPVCSKCLDKLKHQKTSTHSIIFDQNLHQIGNMIWEYKIIRIKNDLSYNPPIYLFNEKEKHGFPLDQYYWLQNENGNIISITISEILNYFGEKSWELVGFREINKNNNQSSSLYFTPNGMNYDPRFIELEYIFKRKKNQSKNPGGDR